MRKPYYAGDSRNYRFSGWPRTFDSTRERVAEFEKQFDSTEEPLWPRLKRWLKGLLRRRKLDHE